MSSALPDLPPLFAPARRDELLRLFGAHVYGVTPSEWPAVRFEVRSEKPVFEGAATRQIIDIGLEGVAKTFSLLLYLPRQSSPVGAFVGLNFKGIHSVTPDEEVPISASCEPGVPRGAQAHRWPIEMIVARGYALATACYGDIEADRPDGWQDGFRRHLPFSNWGALGVWAWGLSRITDVLVEVDEINSERIAVVGHSRLGKTALWAAAQDERFGLAIANNSGCGGASLTRRAFGESLAEITRRFPHWFAPQFVAFAGRETELPVDQHHLLSLLAPRPLYVASAQDDAWADPQGEFLSCLAASRQWQFWDRRGVETTQWPAVHQPVGQSVGYHLRAGGHGVTDYDWAQWLDFADRQWR